MCHEHHRSVYRSVSRDFLAYLNVCTERITFPRILSDQVTWMKVPAPSVRHQFCSEYHIY